MLRSSGRSVSELERELGITQGLLSKWRRIDEVEKAGTGYQPESESSESTIKRLERENAILRQEREILKKAVAIFSNPNK